MNANHSAWRRLLRPLVVILAGVAMFAAATQISGFGGNKVANPAKTESTDDLSKTVERLEKDIKKQSAAIRVLQDKFALLEHQVYDRKPHLIPAHHQK